ncbi:MAG: Na/Pi symporter [Rhodocyclaceae bacterium]|nr:Na/Pi symporter [Rhodocyclaceae bacterium]MDZ4215412.1 Na/Pi symporter [Rhodocyclaceae bacterium]
MSSWAILGGLAGGVGLFLLGMGLMTDGLRLAAGPALEHILARSTKTRLRGLASGALVTVAVQSSSAVTVAAIGFVNAGLLSLGQALWVLFGANIGTTMTGWLVALVGMKFKIDAFALPLIGVGMLLRLTGEGSRRGAVGMALAGFGVLFLGIDLLKETFSGVAADFTLPQGDGFAGVFVMVLIGILMTVLMQASAAALVIAFSAAQSGMVSLEAAAAVVIGANVGTTVTAVLAAIGATANAKRAAAAHILFNVLTGVVALLLLPWLLAFLGFLRALLELDAGPAATLALFHTVFNIFGVILIWPLAGRLTEFLLERFKSAEEDEARPRYIDKTVLAVPSLALDALARELHRLGGITLATVRTAFEAAPPLLERNQYVTDQLASAITAFIAQLNRGGMATESALRLPELLRVTRYYETAAELATEAAAALRETETAASPAFADWRTEGEALLARLNPDAPTSDVDLGSFEAAYQRLKAELLEAGAQGRLGVSAMDGQLRGASALRRAVEQCAKAVQTLSVSNG